jgi:FkbM family methyltransferase
MNLKDIQQEYREGKINKWEYIDKMYANHILLFDYSEFIKSTNISSIHIQDDSVIMTFRDSDVKLKCARNDKRLAPFDSLNFGSYEADELSMQMSLMNPSGIILDIGGNFGWYAIHVAKRFPMAQIYTFEPIPETYQSLLDNIKINNSKNVTALNFGFSDQKGSFEFYIDPSLSVNASLANVSGNNNLKKVFCKVEQMDHWAAGNVPRIDFIKCDVEGAELLVFKGGKNIIEKYHPVIFTEMLRKWTSKFNYHPNDIISLFDQLNYKCYTSHDGKLYKFNLVDDNTMETNYFFLHELHHQDKIEKYIDKK